jgi:predicted MFS family arabinose efflux permease
MKRIAYISCLGTIGILTTEFGVIGILPQIAAYYHLTIDQASLLLSLFALAVGVLGPFMSMVAARYNRKAVMAASLALFLVTGIVSACSPPFWRLLTIRLLPTLLHSAYFAAALAAVISTTSPSKQHKLMAIALSGINIATVTTVPLSTWLASVFSWQSSFVMQAVVSALALLAILVLLPSLPVTERPTFGNQLQILRKPAVWLSLAMCVLLFAAEFSLYSYFAEYLIRVKAAMPKAISYYMFVFGLTGLLGTWLAGKTLSKSLAHQRSVPGRLHSADAPGAVVYRQHPSTDAGAGGAVGDFILPWRADCYLFHQLGGARGVGICQWPDGLFANFGITLGTVAGGWVISHVGIAHTPWLSLGLGVAAIGLVGARSLWDARRVRTESSPLSK